MTERENLIEVMARAMLADELTLRPTLTFHPAWEQESDIWLSNAKAALTALEAAGVRLVPESVTPKMAVCLESNFSVCEPASEIHAANWRSAYRAMLAASPYAPEAKE